VSLLREGETVSQTYFVERLLGEGAFGEVYRVRHRFLGRQAMKVFKLVGMTIDELDRALSEARILSRIGHPNIIRVYEANVANVQAGQIGYFTMELVPGGALSTFRRSLTAGAFVPVETVIEIIRQVCSGLSVAHRANPPIIHRDIKPQNILVGYENDAIRVRLSDFGLAKDVNPLTLQASTRGTRSFKPPESLAGDLSDSCAADVWAVGLCLYWLLTNAYPYVNEDDPPESIPAFPTHQWVDPSQLNVYVSPRLDDLTRRSLALRPQERYQNASSLLADLDALNIDLKAKPQPGQRLTPNQHSPTDHNAHQIDRGRQLALDATALARDCTRLGEAIDLLEQALQIAPSLQDGYYSRLCLWRKGVTQ